MTKAVFDVALLAFALTGCVTSSSERTIPEEKNPARLYGQAVYLSTRCPGLQTGPISHAMLTYCLYNKANGLSCEKTMANNFPKDLTRGAAEATAEFEAAPDAQVCRAAKERFGEKGSRFARILMPRDKR